MGPDDASYSTILSIIIVVNLLPNMNRVYSQITKQETSERQEAMVERLFNTKVKIIRCGDGKEFSCMKKLL